MNLLDKLRFLDASDKNQTQASLSLKEKQYQKFLEELELEEEILNDEFSTQAYFRSLQN